MDTKRHARFTEPGHAVTGMRTAAAPEARRVGWEFVHTLVDDRSRLAYSEIHDDERAATVTGFTRSRDRLLPRAGIEHRAAAHRQRLDLHRRTRTWPQLLGARGDRALARSTPYSPQTQREGGALQQTMDREWGRGLSYRSSQSVGRRCHTGSTTTTRADVTSSIGNRPPIGSRSGRLEARQLGGALGEPGGAGEGAVEARPGLALGKLPLEAVEGAEAAAEVVHHVDEDGLAGDGDDRRAVFELSRGG